MDWAREIDELHEFFEAWFRGLAQSFERMEIALAPTFSIVGPRGTTMDRAETIAAVREGRGRSSSLRIGTSDHQLLAATPGLVVARYIETHESDDHSTRRLSTAVFEPDETAPNGLVWVTVHETFLDDVS
ncbi:MAG: DUF4440 domain-containing protein [Acidimicrobiia bacterium]|nr:DUF4440 domain-containing protein [Acidimicrobiia bacterium]